MVSRYRSIHTVMHHDLARDAGTFRWGGALMGQVAEGTVTAKRPMTPTEAIVARAWAAELRLPRVGLDEDFIDLGSHSLQGLAIAARLEETFGMSIPVRTLFEEPTVADLAAWIDLRRGDGQPARAEIVLLQSAEGSALRPIFAVPGGRGTAQKLYGLAKLARDVDPARPLYAFPGDPPVPDATEQEDWVAAAAGAINAAMREIQPHGPYLLLGACVGGVITWEMARQLEAEGESIRLLLVDTRNPRLQIGEGSIRHAVNKSLSVEERRARRRQRGEWRRRATPEAPQLPVPDVEGRDKIRRMVMTQFYQPGPLRGHVTLLINQDWRRVSATLGWDGLVDDLAVVVIGQGHSLHWHIPEVAAHAREWLNQVESEDDGSQAQGQSVFAREVRNRRRGEQ